MIKGIFFDVGGTLCRSAKVYNAKPSFKRIIADYTSRQIADFNVQKQPYLWITSGSKQGLIKHLCQDIHFDDWRGLYAMLAQYSYEVELYYDVIPCLKVLKNQYRLGLLCNTTVWTAYDHKKLKLDEYINTSIMSCYVGVAKPDIRIFEYAQKIFKCNANELLHVGDTIKFDIEPALRAGWKAVLLCRDNSIRNAPVPIISDLLQLENAISTF